MEPKNIIEMRHNALGSLVYNLADRRYYWTPQILPDSKSYQWQLWIVIITGILVTPWWLFDKFIPLPHYIITNPIMWWFYLALGLFLPAILWWFGRQKTVFDTTQLVPFDQQTDPKVLMRGWFFERAWILFVLLLLPPTVLLFVWLFWLKSDFLDILLMMLHAALFWRRLIPHAFKRIALSGKELIK